MNADPKRNVRQYYEQVGWSRTSDGLYQDTASFVDNREAVRGYHVRVAHRPARLLRHSGEWFLDAGCGALPAASYLETAKRHRKSVCVDFSSAALREARSKLGGAAAYVQADVSQLPFRDGVFDTVFSAHVLYHLPDTDQQRALLEFVRVLHRAGICAVVYTNPDCLMNRIAVRFSPRIVIPRIPGARWLWRRCLRQRYIGTQSAPPASSKGEPSLFFNPKPLSWLRRVFPDHARMSVRCWASAGLPFTTQFIPNSRVGVALLRLLFAEETVFPRLFGRIGAYPLLLIRHGNRWRTRRAPR